MKFAQATSWVARQAGTPTTFAMAVLLIVIWAVSGPFLDYSDVWQLTINTATTIVTFLMVFILQNSQNRDTEALQIKIDELIRANIGAENALLDLESMPQDDLDSFRDHYRKLAEHARSRGFDLASVIAGMEAEHAIDERKKRPHNSAKKKRKSKSTPRRRNLPREEALAS
ncbi:low affinity iron permease family protein [Nordella sp. HKS 07]|nr:low affinity iron permease family protein [Nordella sp. HKS 07]QIG49275.1 low affinity iron permease family protein [Nordella sp. HKS 07]